MKCIKCGKELTEYPPHVCTSQEVQGLEDQYVTTCCFANHLDKPCVLFGVKIDDNGKRWAIIGYPLEVPIEEVATWSRRAEAEQRRLNDR